MAIKLLPVVAAWAVIAELGTHACCNHAPEAKFRLDDGDHSAADLTPAPLADCKEAEVSLVQAAGALEARVAGIECQTLHFTRCTAGKTCKGRGMLNTISEASLQAKTARSNGGDQARRDNEGHNHEAGARQ